MGFIQGKDPSGKVRTVSVTSSGDLNTTASFSASGVLNTNITTGASGSSVSVQNPLPTDGDSIYVKDIDIANSDNGNFSGSITDYFDSLKTININSSTSNPKTIMLWFNRTIYTNAIGLGCDDISKGFGNSITIELLGSGEVVRSTIQSSGDSNSRLISFTPSAFNGINIKFNTASAICLSNITIQKEVQVKSRIQAIKPNGLLTNIGATNNDNLRVSVQEYGDTPSIDAFGSLRVSEKFTIFDSKQLHDKQPLFWDESLGGSATSVYSSDDAATIMSVTATSGDFVIRQTKQRMNYQPGKLLRNTEPVLTPNGWKPIGDIKVGDKVFDGLGKITDVIGVYPHENKQLYRVKFDDGTEVDAGAEHLWKTIIRSGSHKGEVEIVSTQDMINRHGYIPKHSSYRFRIPRAPILDIAPQDVVVDPYTLGVALGDGHFDKKGFVHIINPEHEIHDRIKFKTSKSSSTDRCLRYSLLGSGEKMRELGLQGVKSETKFIPRQYLFNSKEVRLSILQGLMDTDGSVDRDDGTTEYTTASYQLAEDIAFLVRSLGGQVKIRKRKAGYTNNDGEYIECLPLYRVRVISKYNPFQLERKAKLWKPRTRISYDRYIHSIIPVDKDDATCIRVSSDDHTFLTRNHIVTHNSQLVLFTFLCTCISGLTKRVGIYDASGTNNLTPKNGIFLETGISVSWNICKAGTITETVSQSNWNVDPLDGTGPSGITLDFDTVQIGIIDYEWLGVGRVRTGFVIDGLIHYCHYFNHANISGNTSVYMSTPNLPLRYVIETDGTASGSLSHICSTVVSEGGIEETGVLRSADTSTTHVDADTANTTYAVVGIRLKDAYKDVTVIPEFFSMINEAGDDFRWSLCLNPTIAGTFTYSDLTNSAVQSARGATANTVSDEGILIDSGYAVAGVFGAGGGTNRKFVTSLRMGTTIDSTPDEIVLCVTPLTAGADIQASLTFRELL
jgi:hypothetical protein